MMTLLDGMVPDIVEMREENARLAEQRDALLEELEQVEWVRDQYFDADYCPRCQSFRTHGHAPNCPRQLVLAKVKGE